MIAELVRQAIGLPEWAPRVLRRAALALLLITYAVDRTAFDHGLHMWIAHEQRELMQTFEPMLARMSTGRTS